MKESDDALKLREVLADSLFNSAFQADSRSSFYEKMKAAEVAYINASREFQALGQEVRALRASAKGSFARSWISGNTGDRRDAIKEAVTLAEDASARFEAKGDHESQSRTLSEALRYCFEESILCSRQAELMEICEKASILGDKAVAHYRAINDDTALVDSLPYIMYNSLTLARYRGQRPTDDELEKTRQGRALLAAAAKRLGTPHALALAAEGAVYYRHDVGGYNEGALKEFEEGLVSARETRDSFSQGRLLLLATHACFWIASTSEYRDEKRVMLEKAITLSAESIRLLEISSHPHWLGFAWAEAAECQSALAREVEYEVEKRKKHLRIAVELARKGAEYMVQSGLWVTPAHALSKALYFLGNLTENQDDKEKFLMEALDVRRRENQAQNLLAPDSWGAGLSYHYLAQIEASLADSKSEQQARTESLREAAQDLERCVGLLSKWTTHEMTDLALAEHEENCGDVLFRLYNLNRESPSAHRAVEIYEDSISRLSKRKHLLSIGPVRWKEAKVYNALKDYRRAAQSFRIAADDYRRAAENTSAVASTFTDYSLYMDAWARIEEARTQHEDGRYLQASESYAEAAQLLDRTKNWSHLAKHYYACADLEHGEAFSTQENEQDAKKCFERAASGFREAQIVLGNCLKLSEQEARPELANWIGVSQLRENYSLGRQIMEAAEFQSRKGNGTDSASSYREASRAFNDLLKQAAEDSSRAELNTLIGFCDAFARMKDAESKTHPELYAEAAEAFRKTAESSPREKLRLQALANSCICRSLEYGLKFRLTQDTELYSEIKKQLERASNYYAEAGLSKAEMWARASERFFDALAYLARAEVEIDASAKTRYYHLAEKNLEAASKLYAAAGYDSKKSETMKQLERAREQKELLLTPIQALSEDPTRLGTSIAPISLTRDQPLGLDNLEEARIVASVNVHRKEVTVGSEEVVEIDIANVGKKYATLLRLEGVLPEGFEVNREKTTHRVEDRSVNLRGKRLDYLKSEEVKVAIRAKSRGDFELRPIIQIIDEAGRRKACPLDPVSITVRELGISGWVKGSK